MNFTDILRTAIHALRGNWMRSALTSLGVIIGIAAVIVMVSVGQGTQAVIVMVPIMFFFGLPIWVVCRARRRRLVIFRKPEPSPIPNE